MRLKGKKALITGASKGIGREVVLGFAREGADVAMAARSEDKLKALAADVTRMGRRAVTIPADMTDRAQIRAMVDRAVRELGQVDILVNNAGMLDNSPIRHHDEEMWDRMVALNLTAYMLCIKYSVGPMIDRGWGRIINTCSVSAQLGMPNRAAYVSTKHGVLGLTKAVGVELAATGVTCNCICPGFVISDMVEHSMANFARDMHKTKEETRKIFESKIPIKRFIEAEEIVPLYLYLASAESKSMTAKAIWFDGGLVDTMGG